MDKRVKEEFKRTVINSFSEFVRTSGINPSDEQQFSETFLEYLISRSFIEERIIQYAFIINFVNNSNTSATKTQRVKDLEALYDIPEQTSWNIIKNHQQRFLKK